MEIKLNAYYRFNLTSENNEDPTIYKVVEFDFYQNIIFENVKNKKHLELYSGSVYKYLEIGFLYELPNYLRKHKLERILNG